MIMARRKSQVGTVRAEHLLAALRERYGGREWVLLRQVAEAAGVYSGRMADAVAMNLWPSRGLELHGFELKVGRRDWLRELKDPAKAEAICQFCDRWWIVAPRDVVQPDELPGTWGLLVAHGRHLRCQVQAPRLKPLDIDRPFLAALLRRAAASCEVGREYMGVEHRVYQRGRRDGEREAAREVAHAKSVEAACEESRIAFEAASGLVISTWNAGQIGEAVAVIRSLRGEGEGLLQRLQTAADDLARHALGLDQLIGSVRRVRDAVAVKPLKGLK